MSKSRVQQLIDAMDPLEAAEEMTEAAKRLFSLLGEEALRDFLSKLIGEENHDGISGLVHL